MSNDLRKAGRKFNKFLKLTFGNYMRLLFGYRIFNEQIAGLNPPFIVIANHTNFYDPFLLSMCIPDPVHFVTSDAYFRNPVLKFLLKHVGAIPKTKFISDPQSIKHILRIVKNKGIVGIFAEGRRNWDGSTLPLLFPTAKLAKSLGIPVVSVLFRGACLSMPRWSKSTRKGGLTMTCTPILSGEDVKKLSANEIFDVMTASLAHDEYAWQRRAMIRYKGRKMAEKLELFLFLCPECKSDKHMESKDDAFFCTNCGYTVKYNEYGFFKPESDKLYFDNPRDWNLWQLAVLENEILSCASMERPIFEETGVTAWKGGKSNPLVKFGTGMLHLYKNRIVFTSGKSGDLSFNLSDLSGENIQFNDQLEFYHEKDLYRFGGNRRTISVYKWVRALEMLKEGKK